MYISFVDGEEKRET